MSGKRETTDRARRPPPPTRTARRHRPSQLLPLQRTDPAWTALAPRPPRRPPRLPRPLTRNLQPPRCCREDERQENRPSADLVTGLVRADPAKRRSQRQRRRRRNPRFLSLGAGRYRAVPFLSPIRRWTNRLGIELFPPDSRGPNPVTPIRVVQRGRRHRRPPLTQSELDSGRLVHNRQDHSRFSYSVPPYRRLTPAFGGRSIEKVGRARLTVGRARSMTPANPMDKPIFKRCVWLPYTGSRSFLSGVACSSLGHVSTDASSALNWTGAPLTPKVAGGTLAARGPAASRQAFQPGCQPPGARRFQTLPAAPPLRQ